MDEKEKLKELIDNSKKPTVSEWVYEVEAFLEEINEPDTEAWTLIDGIKQQGDHLPLPDAARIWNSLGVFITIGF